MNEYKTTIYLPEYLHLKLLQKSKSSSLSRAEIIRQALDLYFRKQEDEKILDIIFSKIEGLSEDILSNQNLGLNKDLLPTIHKMIVEIYIQSVRTNVFLNKYTEGYLLKPEDYKDLRKRVSDEMGTIIKNEGLEKK